MATGIIAALTSGTSVSYTATVDSKLVVSGTGTAAGASVNINGVPALQIVGSSTVATNGQVTHFIGAGQTVTVSATTATQAIVSVLEGN